MTSFAGLGWRVWLAAAALATSAGCDTGQDCTDAACGDGVSAEAELPMAAVDHLLTVCVDARCASGTLPIDDRAGTLSCAALAGPFTAQACAWPPDGRDAGSSTPLRRLDVSVGVSEGLSLDALLATRSLRLQVVDPGGVSLLDETRPVHFRSVYPNGEDCGGACRQAPVRF